MHNGICSIYQYSTLCNNNSSPGYAYILCKVMIDVIQDESTASALPGETNPLLRVEHHCRLVLRLVGRQLYAGRVHG